MRLLCLTLCVLFSGTLFADDLNCVNKVAAVYSPGPNWSQLGQVIDLHLQFIAAKLNSGAMNEAGPFMGKDGPTGGFMVYNGEDTAAVEKMVQEDPFVAKGIAVYEIRTWMKCTGK